MPRRDLLTIDELSAAELAALLDDADQLKAEHAWSDDLHGRAVGLLFEQPAMHLRVAFDLAVRELGGHPVVLTADELQLGDRACLADAARALARSLDALVVSSGEHGRVEALAAATGVPVINARSGFACPCQVLADLQTIREYKGTLAGVRLAYLGDGGAVANSLLRGGALAGMHVAVASPPGYEPIPQVVEFAEKLAAADAGSVLVTTNPLAAARGADVVYTDAWATMEQGGERDARKLIFQPFQVGYHVMEAAAPDAIVMHPLPAHRGDEIAADVLEGQQSVVWAQAANRRPALKALLRLLLGGEG